MNIVIFSQRLQQCRKRKYSSQQAFADAYMNRYGMIRKPKNTRDNNMFGTIQSWEQGKSTPTADVLANICDLLECDADFLLGRIDQRTHDISDAQRYTGLSATALEQLHKYHESLKEYPDPKVIIDMNERWGAHPYYQAYALYLIDELLVGSKSHKLSVSILDLLYEKVMEGEIGIKPEDYGDASDYDGPSEDDRELWAAQCREFIDMITFRITSNIRDIIYENAVDMKLPPALKIHDDGDNVYHFGTED